MLSALNPNEKTVWKRINMRNVEDLLGVEFIHDLYNRHDPKINSIRFRHTKTIWKDGVVNSYAPTDEWQFLCDVLGYKYYSLDKDLIFQTKKLYRRKRFDSKKIIKKINSKDLSKISNKELSILLVDFQSIILGDLYVLNFVQIEHALNCAINKILKEKNKNQSEVDFLLTSLIQTNIPTESQRESYKLYRTSLLFYFLKKIGLYSEKTAKRVVHKHYEKYKFLYSAYGEKPRGFEIFWDSFNRYLNRQQKKPKHSLFQTLMSSSSRALLKKIKNDKLHVLIPLITMGGVFRDKNKSILGLSLKHRFAILDEIANRGCETRDNLNYYLLSEIFKLLNESRKIEGSVIELRKTNGVLLTRNEDACIFSNDLQIVDNSDDFNCKILHGQCASRGKCSGKCKIVLSKEDVSKVDGGDIMVAIGTDFDLIEAMYKSSAVITEESGILSHAAVVCRELDKPCCIGVKNITRILKDNQSITLDATNGDVYIQ